MSCQSTDLVTLRGKRKNCWDYAHRTEFWYLLGVLFKTSDDHPRHFYVGVPPSLGIRDRYVLCNNLSKFHNDTSTNQPNNISDSIIMFLFFLVINISYFIRVKTFLKIKTVHCRDEVAEVKNRCCWPFTCI